MKLSCVIAGSRPWCSSVADRIAGATDVDCIFVQDKDELTPELLASVNPRYVFFPHWSWIIPQAIWHNYECVIFHMTDLPFGRGGSPLQNLIAKGYTETKISALRCVRELDAGPVYLKRPLSLFGSAEEIYLRANENISDMILEILSSNLMPVPQVGEPTLFQRRKPQDSNISELKELKQLFDHIRMLDAEGYPAAFMETDNFRLSFSRASLRVNGIHADVVITLKPQNGEPYGK